MSDSFKYTGSYIRAGNEIETPVLLGLAHHGNPAVRRRLAENPKAPADIVESLSRDPDPSVRSAVAWNSAASLPTLERLSRDTDINVRLALTEVENMPQPILSILLKDENPYIRHHAKKAIERRLRS